MWRLSAMLDKARCFGDEKRQDMARDIDPFKVSSPRIFLVRMLVFLILCGLIVVVIHPQILVAFKANPPLNALIIGVLVIGIMLAFRQVIRLFREVAWVNGFRLADPGIAVERPPVLLAPMAAILGDRVGRMSMSSQTMRSILDSVAIRLDEAREISRYMTGLLIFLGLLGTFWGLIETVSSVGAVINNLKVGGDANAMFDSLREGLAAPLSGMGISFSSSLFGLAGSLVLGFLDLQMSQAQNRFHTELEDWLATTVHDLGGADRRGRHRRRSGGSGEMRAAIERLREAITSSGSNKAATNAMANLAEAIQGLVHHMRTEQQMIRDWVDSQAEQHREIRRLLETHDARAGRQVARRTTDEWNDMALSRARRDRGIDYWPGFVDALSTLILGIIFLLTVFVVVQFVLSQEVTGKDTALQRLSARIAQLTDLLGLEQTNKVSLEDQIAQLRANLATTETERDRIKGLYEGLSGGTAAAQDKANDWPASSTPRSRSRSARSRRSRCSTSSSPRCAASSARWSRRSKSPRKRTRIRSPASPISASG